MDDEAAVDDDSNWKPWPSFANEMEEEEGTSRLLPDEEVIHPADEKEGRKKCIH